VTHPNYPSERSPTHCPLDSATFRAVDEYERRFRQVQQDAYDNYLRRKNDSARRRAQHGTGS
jgi:hypothetical protein